MKRIIVMLGIGVLVAAGFLPLPVEARGAVIGPMRAEARGATIEPVRAVDQDLVRDAQRQLRGLGFNPGPIDGNFGPQTQAALRAYQQAYRLPQTGRLDETTLRSLLPDQFEASRAPVDVSNREVVVQSQRQLRALGFDPGRVDGNMGPQTEAALRAYQQAYRLPQTGRLDEVTLRSLLPDQFEASRAPVDVSNREVVVKAQRQLRALGFDPGDVDGEIGSQTEAALRAYQQAYRLPQTGRLDETTLHSLLPEMRQGTLR